MIGIIGAMQVETMAISELLTDKTSETVSGVTFNRGKIGSAEVVVATCGIGKVFAAICAQAMIMKYAPKAIINVGVAGSLNDSLNICDVVIANSVVQHDMDTSPLGDPKGMISGINKIYFECDEDLCARIKNTADKLGIKSISGIVASGDKFVSDPQEKKQIATLFNADACEMEGAAIGHVCFVNNTPFCVLRSISDGAGGDGAMDFMQFCDAAAKQTTRLIAEMFK